MTYKNIPPFFDFQVGGATYYRIPRSTAGPGCPHCGHNTHDAIDITGRRLVHFCDSQPTDAPVSNDPRDYSDYQNQPAGEPLGHRPLALCRCGWPGVVYHTQTGHAADCEVQQL